jgi:ketosteroid isomerase-like protein
MRQSSAQALATVVLAVAGMFPLSAAHAAQPDEKAVPQASAQFYTALNAMFTGNIEPMNAVWSHTEDVTCMGPDGKFTIGWDQISASWKRQAEMKLGGKVQPEAMHVTIGQDLAVVECLEVGENIVKGKPQTVSLRATNVFRKTDGQWKMIGHHTDLLPFLAQ